jgi:hypothetical protein
MCGIKKIYMYPTDAKTCDRLINSGTIIYVDYVGYIGEQAECVKSISLEIRREISYELMN